MSLATSDTVNQAVADADDVRIVLDLISDILCSIDREGMKEEASRRLSQANVLAARMAPTAEGLVRRIETLLKPTP